MDQTLSEATVKFTECLTQQSLPGARGDSSEAVRQCSVLTPEISCSTLSTSSGLRALSVRQIDMRERN